MIYKTLKVGDRIKCFSKDEADHLVYILEGDGFKCIEKYLGDGCFDVLVCGLINN
jgi:hypothetical protein